MNQQEFINKVKGGAIKGWTEYKVLPSITIAQSILESGWGRSELATKANNLFGIKAKSDWNGKSYIVRTAEYDKDNNKYYINAPFRAYDSWEESILDHSKFFTCTEWRKQNYASFIGQTDYKIAANKLQECGYATSQLYASSLIDIIERYNLNQYDNKVSESNLGDDKLKIFLSVGHSILKNGATTSAGGCVNEYEYNKQLAPYIKAELEKLGHQCDVIICPERKFNGWREEKSYKLPIANSGKYDLVCELHLNSFNGKAKGSEVFYYRGDKRGLLLANKVVENLATQGFQNRGSKTAALYMTNETIPLAILVESFFCDNQEDYNRAKVLGFEKMAKCIAYGMLGKDIPNNDTPIVENKKEEIVEKTDTPQDDAYDLVTYSNDIDKIGADIITQNLQVPSLSIDNYNKVKDKYKRVIHVGGISKAPTGAFVLAGKDRDETIDLVQAFVKHYR